MTTTQTTRAIQNTAEIHGYQVVQFSSHERQSDAMRRAPGPYAWKAGTALPEQGSTFSECVVVRDCGARWVEPEHRAKLGEDLAYLDGVIAMLSVADLKAECERLGMQTHTRNAKGRFVIMDRESLAVGLKNAQITAWWPFKCV